MQYVPRLLAHVENFEFVFGQGIEWNDRAKKAVNCCKYNALTLIKEKL